MTARKDTRPRSTSAIMAQVRGYQMLIRDMRWGIAMALDCLEAGDTEEAVVMMKDLRTSAEDILRKGVDNQVHTK